MTLQLCPLVIASLLAFETIATMPQSAQAFERSMTASVCTSDRPTYVDLAYELAKKLPGRRQGAGSR